MKKIISLIFLSTFVIFSALADGLVPIPELNSRVTDQINLFSAQEKQLLEQKLSTFEQNNGSQIVVLVIETTGFETIEEYSMRVAETWKIGREEHDDGVILLVAKNDRKLRIEVGYGLEGKIPDATAKWIIDEQIVPKFKKGDFVGGINKGVDQLIALAAGLTDHTKIVKKHNRNKKLAFWPLMLMYALIFMGPGLIATLRKEKLWYAIVATALILLADVYYFFHTNDLSATVLFVIFTIGMAILAFSTRGRRGNLTIPVTRFFILAMLSGGSGGGSSSSGGSSFGSSGGGFSGGGGSFGGGGASGSW